MESKKASNSTIAARVRATRTLLEMNQIAFAQRLGVAQTTVSMWEVGKARPTPDAFTRLAAIANEAEAKRFFLAEAGIPFNDSGEIDFGLKALGDRMMGDGRRGLEANPKLATGRDEPRLWDADLMIVIIETVNKKLREKGRKLPDKKYARLVTLLYDFCYGTRRPDSAIVEQFLKIA